MSKKIFGIATVFSLIFIMSMTSFANSYSHYFSGHTETCSLTVTGSDTYNAYVKAEACNYKNKVLKSDHASNTSLYQNSISVSSYHANATKGKWYVDCTSNQHINVVINNSGTDT